MKRFTIILIIFFALLLAFYGLSNIEISAAQSGYPSPPINTPIEPIATFPNPALGTAVLEITRTPEPVETQDNRYLLVVMIPNAIPDTVLNAGESYIIQCLGNGFNFDVSPDGDFVTVLCNR